MELLDLNLFNYITLILLIIGCIVTAYTYIIYSKNNRINKRYNKIKNNLLIILNGNNSEINNKKLLHKIKKLNRFQLGKLLIEIDTNDKNKKYEKILTLFSEEHIQHALIDIVFSKEIVSCRVHAMRLLSNFSSKKAIDALKKACIDEQQEVSVSAAIFLVENNPELDISEMIELVSTRKSLKNLFLFLKWLNPEKILAFSNSVKIAPDNDILFSTITQVSIKYLIPHLINLGDDQRALVKEMSELLLKLQDTPANILHSFYILNKIDEECFIKKKYSATDFVTQHFDFKSNKFTFDRV